VVTASGSSIDTGFDSQGRIADDDRFADILFAARFAWYRERLSE
jgi:hypothetical protein